MNERQKRSAATTARGQRHIQEQRRQQANRERIARQKRQQRVAAQQAVQKTHVTETVPDYVVDKETLEKYDNTCYLVGGGPSLIGFDWSNLDGKFVVGVNRAYEVLPDAQIIYFTDDDWWNVHHKNLLKHKGQLIKGSLNLKRMHHPRVLQYHLTGETGWETGHRKLKHGRNSSFACMNMLIQHLGFKKIYLLGLDMKWGQKGKKNTSHWHNGHKRIDAENVYTIMKRNIGTIPQLLNDNGHSDVEIISVNTPEKCDLKTFPMKSLEDVFGS